MGGFTKTDRPSFGLRFLMYALTFLFVVSSVELLSALAIKILKPMGIFYDPSTVTQNYIDYLALRDENLGWSPRGTKTTIDGARNDPAFSTRLEPCISMFGDSFTWSEEVEDSDSW